MSAQADFTHTFDFHSWDGKPLQHLPYFERVASFIAAASTCGQPIQIHLEIVGNRILSGATSSLLQDERIQSIDWLLNYVGKRASFCVPLAGPWNSGFRKSAPKRPEQCMNCGILWSIAKPARQISCRAYAHDAGPKRGISCSGYAGGDRDFKSTDRESHSGARGPLVVIW